MTQQPTNIQVKDIDHLGIVAGIIDQMSWVDEINQLVGTHSLEQVSTGQLLKAMILNGLGFVAAPLYLLAQFFEGKATEHLIGEGVKPEHLSDDRLGRALDKFYQVGATQVFTTLAMKAVEQFGVSVTSIHLDSSSFHVDGEYVSECSENSSSQESAATSNSATSSESASPQEPEGDEPKPIAITHGYSRDHRPDLKQFIIDTVCTADGDVPLFLRVADGNEDDKTSFTKLFEKFREQWTFEGLCVADSALYTADNLIAMKQLKWLTRVPLTLAQAKVVLLEIQANEWQTSRLKGYRLAERQSCYGGVQQRWFIVESEQRKQADIQQLHKRIDKEYKQQSVKLRQLSTQEFACEPDARAAAVKFEQLLKYHRLEDLKFIPQAYYDKAGRPRQDEAPSRITYSVQATVVPNPEVIEVEMLRAGRFILATNVLDAIELSPDQALSEYKDQQSNERGFRFLKDPLFFTSSIFVKSPRRVEALAMVMGLCLLVYALAQRQLRQALEQTDEAINNQAGKLTQRPSLRWVFLSFQAVHLLIVDDLKQITNLTPERRKILRFLGTDASRYYQLC
ncbi:IS1634 family transposase [Coleofasciculus sp. FACHB-T130]|uniref:IS1634 family transposase n=1 Tax=Cyanophyceae TaxID=3028117 RepID=UPI001685863F|nr:IS1634 family transposase [Coleofasciculus sp. FACHB-T130]MBD1877757.1 IS1634 family transposase [Coleofasciculus sp. FACHB-T130]